MILFKFVPNTAFTNWFQLNTGSLTESLQENHYASDIGSCGACMCNQYGTSEGSLQCDADGNCPCKVGQDLIDGQKCDGCPPGQTLSQNAVDKSTSCMGNY